jgi:hypothetical protein
LTVSPYSPQEAVVNRAWRVERIDRAQGFGCGEHVGGDDFIQQAGELAIRQLDAVQRLKLFAEVALQRGAVSNV